MNQCSVRSAQIKATPLCPRPQRRSFTLLPIKMAGSPTLVNSAWEILWETGERAWLAWLREGGGRREKAGHLVTP